MDNLSSRQTLSKAQQTDITRIAIKAAQILQQHGAESRIIEQLADRLGVALGCDNVELSISANALVLTTLYQGTSVTTTRQVVDRGINMQMLCEVQSICVMVEKGLLTADDLRERLNQLVPLKYNRWLVVAMVGLSCASFCHLFGGDWPLFGLTFIASATAMFIRQELAQRQHNPLINFGFAAFVATLIASLGPGLQIGNQPYLAMAASVLLLVPGVPLINAVSDMVKGHVNMGIARWAAAWLLTVAVCSGIVLAVHLTGVSVMGWL